MPENEFEKQVQELFGDMRLKPSAEVWSKVHERISSGKKRRKVFVWLPLALLLLGGAGYWMMQHGTETPSATIVQQAGQVHSTENKQSVAGNTGDQQNTETITPEVVAQPGKVVDKTASANTAEKNEVEASTSGVGVNANKTATDKGVAGNKNELVKNDAVKNGVAVNGIKSKNIKQKRSGSDIGVKERELPLAGAEIAEVNIPVVGYQQEVDGYQGLKDIGAEKNINKFAKAQMPVAAKPVVKLAKKKSWEFGVSSQAGASSIGKGLSGVFTNDVQEKTLYNSAVSPASPTAPDLGFLGNQNNLVAAAPPPASAVRTGMAWSAGGFGKWHVKPRLALTFGAEYSLYTTHREVGNAVDNNRNFSNAGQDANARYAAYYTGGDGVDYTNRYHFVQVPIGIQWQLNKGIKLPVQLDAGLALAYLVNTNAVHYRAHTGVYYEDKSLFNKFQTGVYAGFTVKLFQHTARPLYVGPTVQYNLSGLTKASSGLTQNFTYAGLKVQWVLWKK